jgi:hypothetical protein
MSSLTYEPPLKKANTNLSAYDIGICNKYMIRVALPHMLANACTSVYMEDYSAILPSKSTTRFSLKPFLHLSSIAFKNEPMVLPDIERKDGTVSLKYKLHHLCGTLEPFMLSMTDPTNPAHVLNETCYRVGFDKGALECTLRREGNQFRYSDIRVDVGTVSLSFTSTNATFIAAINTFVVHLKAELCSLLSRHLFQSLLCSGKNMVSAL